LILSAGAAARYRPPFAELARRFWTGTRAMAAKSFRGRKILGGFLVALLVAGAAIGWTERTPLLSWLYVQGLVRANEVTLERWTERVAGMGDAVLPDLLEQLANSNPSACANVRDALLRLTSDRNGGVARRVRLAARLARDWERFSDAGKACSLEIAAAWFHGEPAAPAELISACAHLLAASVRDERAEVQANALSLCAALLAQPGGAEAVSPGRVLARACLGNAEAATRVHAIRLALHPGMDLLEEVAPLLSDPTPEVRRAALMAVGPADQVVRDETLLPCLHDADAEVRRLCELALRGRGLTPEHIQLGRLLTDPSPVVRLQVLDLLRRTPDLDTGIWLRRLSHDPSPAVRAASMRAMSQQCSVDLTDRIDQMARNDPSPTICMLARYYLKNAHPTHDLR
jgi:HEAT repeats